MARILVTRRLPDGGLDPLVGPEIVPRPDDVPYTDEELHAAVGDVDAMVTLLTDHVDEAVIAAASRLRVVGNVTVGYDNVDVTAAAPSGGCRSLSPRRGTAGGLPC